MTGIWLVLMGVIGLGILHFGALDTIAALVPIATGIFLLIGRRTSSARARSADARRG